MVCKSHHGVTHRFEVSILKFYILEPKVTMLDEGVKKKYKKAWSASLNAEHSNKILEFHSPKLEHRLLG